MGRVGEASMTRFEKAIEEWRNHSVDVFLEVVKARIKPAEIGPAEHILLDVIKVVDSYERTIKDLKKQNNKLRRGGR